MQPYDMIMVAVLAVATIFGFWKGLAWQVASLASLVVSYVVALKFADQVAPMVSDHAPWNKFLAMLLIYAGTSLIVWMLFRIVAGTIDRVKLKEFDRQMGALVGFAKGVLLCIAITFFAVSLLGDGQRESIIGSKSGQAIVALLDKADAVAPPEIHKVIDPYIKKVEERLDPNFRPNPSGDLQQLNDLWRQQSAAASQQGGGAAWPTSQPSAQQPSPQATWPTTPAWPASTQSR